ncbi:MAG TPA: crosslink repair DNA glycosylase YcaQ family protein [Candidatus Dormibacteraeota bacterium]|nr:crosslink repair DNA glycosylase YcaQ family protein [Candidatus Dormibacteraeota bacterium]
MHDRAHFLERAERLADRVGVLSVFPGACEALPSLWEAVTGSREVTVFTVDDRGRRVLTAELSHVWWLKNQLAEQRRACVGKHVRGRLVVLSPKAVPLMYARTGRSGRVDDFDEPEHMPGLELELARALLEAGPATGPELRRLVGSRSAPITKRALASLQGRFIITQVGEAGQPAGWAAAVFDLVARRFGRWLRHLSDPDSALALLAEMLLWGVGELSAGEVAWALGAGRAESMAALDRLVEEGSAQRRLEGRTLVYRATSGQP